MNFTYYEYIEKSLWYRLLIGTGFYMTATAALIFVHRYIINKNSNIGFIVKIIKDIKSFPKKIKDGVNT